MCSSCEEAAEATGQVEDHAGDAADFPWAISRYSSLVKKSALEN